MSEDSDNMNYWIKTESMAHKYTIRHHMLNLAHIGLMLLDPNIIVSCDDLKFTHNVWKSSRDSLVGYLPRLHSIR